MDYLRLTEDHKREIATNHLLELESEHYSLAMRLRAYEGAEDVSDENKQEMIRQTRAQLGSIEAALAVYRSEIESLPPGE